MSKKCIICNREEKGDILTEINIADYAIYLERMGIVLKDDQFICIDCRSHIINRITGGKLNISIDNTIAFQSFISSSAHLFKLNIAEVTQSCFNLFESGIINNSDVEALQLLDIAKEIIDRDINIIKNKINKGGK